MKYVAVLLALTLSGAVQAQNPIPVFGSNRIMFDNDIVANILEPGRSVFGSILMPEFGQIAATYRVRRPGNLDPEFTIRDIFFEGMSNFLLTGAVAYEFGPGSAPHAVQPLSGFRALEATDSYQILFPSNQRKFGAFFRMVGLSAPTMVFLRFKRDGVVKFMNPVGTVVGVSGWQWIGYGSTFDNRFDEVDVIFNGGVAVTCSIAMENLAHEQA